jgi:CheY-like chemotaxis protein
LSLKPNTSVIGKVAIQRVPADQVESPVLVGLVLPDEVQPPRPAPIKHVMVAEDLELHRTIIRDALNEQGLVERITLAGRGDQFVTLFTQELIAGAQPNLLILDIDLPGLDGYHAAVAARAIELAYGVLPTHVIFFTARPCDTAFKRVLQEVGMAAHIYKGAPGGPAFLSQRLKQVLAAIAKV